MRKAVVVAAIKQSLSTLRNHTDVAGLERYLFCSDVIAKSAPAHVAMHCFDGTFRNPSPGRFVYTKAHAHKVWELVIVIPTGRGFEFQCETDGHIDFIDSASTIIIPSGVLHRMEVVRGRGMLFCIVCSPSYGKSLLGKRRVKRK
jgi:hypothetical protein